MHGDPNNPLIILTRRASHLKNHAGEVAFPGGMKESHDKDLLATALRETEEEIGLPSSAVNVLEDCPLIHLVPIIYVSHPLWDG